MSGHLGVIRAIVCCRGWSVLLNIEGPPWSGGLLCYDEVAYATGQVLVKLHFLKLHGLASTWPRHGVAHSQGCTMPMQKKVTHAMRRDEREWAQNHGVEAVIWSLTYLIALPMLLERG